MTETREGTRLCETPDPRPAPSGTSFFSLIAHELLEVDGILLEELRSRQPIVQQLVDYTAQWRGKRLRPALLLLCGKACGELKQDHKILAAVVEMIHTATLVHDDVLDDAALRRHYATVNARWGDQTSVLFGDFLFTHAFHLASILESTFACRVIGEATNIVCAGELRQIHERGNYDLDERDYLEIVSNKTAELCAVSCRLGAFCSHAPPDVQQAMERYGRNLGVAFQIADDLLDYLGDEQEVGKSLGSDLEQHKLTLPLIRLLQDRSPHTGSQVRKILSGSGNHKRDALTALLQGSDAISYSRRRALDFARESRSELACLPDSAEKNVLMDLTELAVTRRH